MHEGVALGGLFGVTKLVVGLFLETLSQRLCTDQVLGDPACLPLAGESQAGCSWPRHSSLLIINHERDHLALFDFILYPSLHLCAHSSLEQVLTLEGLEEGEGREGSVTRGHSA